MTRFPIIILFTLSMSIFHKAVSDMYNNVPALCDDKWMYQKVFAESLINCVFLCDINNNCLGLNFDKKKFECQLYKISPDCCTVQNDLNVPFYRRNEDSCKSGWLRFQEHCYLFMKGEFNLTEAQALCENEAAYMVEITSFTVQEFLKQKMNKDGIAEIWTGGRAHQGQWKWAHSGQPFVYSDWSPYDPDGDGIAMLYSLYYSGGKWADLPSYHKRSVICQSDSDNN